MKTKILILCVLALGAVSSPRAEVLDKKKSSEVKIEIVQNAPFPKNYSEMTTEEIVADMSDIKEIRKFISESCQSILKNETDKSANNLQKNKKFYSDFSKGLMALGLLDKDELSKSMVQMAAAKTFEEMCIELNAVAGSLKNPRPCQSNDKRKIKRCLPPSKMVAVGEPCIPNRDICVKGICRKVDHFKSSFNSCVFANNSCQQNEDCCSGFCDMKMCNDQYKCLQCIPEGLKANMNIGEKCCPGLFLTPESLCSSSLVQHAYELNILDFFISKADAAENDTSIENNEINSETKKRIDAQKKSLEDLKQEAQKNQKLKTDADAYRYSLGADKNDDQSQISSRTSLIMGAQNSTVEQNIKQQFNNKKSAPQFFTLNQTSGKNCRFSWQDDLRSMMTESERKSQAILEAFELISVNDVVDDYFKNSSGKNIHTRIKEVAVKFKTLRGNKIKDLRKNSDDLRCMCIGLKGPANSDLMPADYSYFSNQCQNSSDPNLKAMLDKIALIKAQKDTGADGVQYKIIFLEYLKNQKNLYEKIMDTNLDVTTDLMNLFDQVVNIEWGESIESSDVQKECVLNLDFIPGMSALEGLIEGFTTGDFSSFGEGLLGTVPGVQLYNLLSYETVDDGYNYGQIKVAGEGITGGLKYTHTAWPGPHEWEGGFCYTSWRPKLGNVKYTRNIYVSPNATCGVSAPANFCVKTVLKIDEHSLRFPNIYGAMDSATPHYLVDPFIPGELNFSLNNTVVKNGDSLNFNTVAVGSPFYEKFKIYVKNYIKNEGLLFFSDSSQDEFAKYVWQYHFILPALKFAPTYPSSGLINYLAFLVEHSMIISEMRGKNVFHNLDHELKVAQDIKATDLSMEQGVVMGEELNKTLGNELQVKSDENELLKDFYLIANGGDLNALSRFSRATQNSKSSISGTKMGKGSSLANVLGKYASLKKRQLDRKEKIQTIVKNAGKEREYYEHQLINQAKLFASFSSPMGVPVASSSKSLISNSAKGEGDNLEDLPNASSTPDEVWSDHSSSKNTNDEREQNFAMGRNKNSNIQRDFSVGPRRAARVKQVRLDQRREERLPLKGEATLWEIITRRYILSGIPKLLEDEKNE